MITISAINDSDGKCGGQGSPLGNSGSDDTYSRYSNWGPVVDIAAPGTNILSTLNDGDNGSISGTAEGFSSYGRDSGSVQIA